MIELNPQYEMIFSPDNIDNDCDRIAHEVDVVGDTIKEILKVGLYNMAVFLVPAVAEVDDKAFCGG